MSEKIAGPDLSRRKLLRQTALGAVAGGITLLARSAFALPETRSCEATPPQTEGPFYPVRDQLDKDNDLTFVKGGTTQARGQVIYIAGSVVDEECRPVANALVEIWQACTSGRYNHPNDPNTAWLDPNFQYWGKAVSKDDGSYLFKTILPGSYPAGPGWVRPPHIHFRVLKTGYRELTSQLYFAGQTLNRSDRILQDLSASEQKRVITELKPADPTRFGPEAQIGHFEITLIRV
jgi:protocatechuate 3,4-dioxygenase beta subunit